MRRRRPAPCSPPPRRPAGRLWATVRVWNAPSFRVPEKLGFERDHLSTDDRGEIVWLTRTLP